MRLDELLAHPDLGLVPLVSGSAGSRLRAIRGAHAIETPEPSRWVPADWVVLTTGMRLRDDPAARRGLVTELANRGVAALGFGIGIVFDTVPAEVEDEARERQLGLFTVPIEVGFREVVRAVDSAVLTGDLETYRRSTTITDALVQRLVGPDPEPAVVMTLSRLLGCGTSLHDPDGNTIVSSDGADGAALRWHRLGRRPLSGPPVEVVGADGLFASAVIAAERTEAWLVVEVGRQSGPVPLIVRAVTTAARLLQGLRTARAGEASARRARRAEALRAMLTPGATHADLAVARAEGLDPAAPATVLVVAEPGTTAPESALDEAESALDEALTRERLRHLVAMHDGVLVAWIVEEPVSRRDASDPDPTGLDPATLPPALIATGAGRSPGGVPGLLEAHRNALVASDHARRTGARLIGYDDLPRLDRLVATVGHHVVHRAVGDVLDPLDANPHLRETVDTWLDRSMSVRATARALGLHENSVRHRLTRASSLMGRGLDDPSLVAELQLARLVGRPEPRTYG